MTRSVKEFYSGYVEKEWARFQVSPYQGLEHATTNVFLQKYLPKRGLVLDAGGGPGRYTTELAKRGYDMVLLDLTPANLVFARKQIALEKVGSNVKEVMEGSIVDLSRFPDGHFDAVMCTGGPLSHVISESDRRKAVSELIRVAKPRSPIFISVMSRLAVLVTELEFYPEELLTPLFEKLRDTGDYLGERAFTATHFFLPEELREIVEHDGRVKVLEMVGLQGISSNHNRAINELAKRKRRWKVWMETHYKTCTHPSVVGLSDHMLVVCRKKVVGPGATRHN